MVLNFGWLRCWIHFKIYFSNKMMYIFEWNTMLKLFSFRCSSLTTLDPPFSKMGKDTVRRENYSMIQYEGTVWRHNKNRKYCTWTYHISYMIYVTTKMMSQNDSSLVVNRMMGRGVTTSKMNYYEYKSSSNQCLRSVVLLNEWHIMYHIRELFCKRC